jgi:hypothetical protein
LARRRFVVTVILNRCRRPSNLRHLIDTNRPMWRVLD